MTTARFNKPLLLAGALLFLAGLLQGAVVDSFANPRMALSAHLTAVQSGMALMIAAIVWRVVTLPDALTRLARWTILVGMWGLWLGLTLAAATGASEALPMAGEGYGADPVDEQAVTVIVLASSGLMTVGWALFVAGIARWQKK